MGSSFNLLDLYLEASTEEILGLIDRDNLNSFLNAEWRKALMEEYYNRTIPRLAINDRTIPMEELTKVKTKNNRGRKK